MNERVSEHLENVQSSLIKVNKVYLNLQPSEIYLDVSTVIETIEYIFSELELALQNIYSVDSKVQEQIGKNLHFLTQIKKQKPGTPTHRKVQLYYRQDVYPLIKRLIQFCKYPSETVYQSDVRTGS